MTVPIKSNFNLMVVDCRHILSTKELWFKDIATLLAEKYRSQGKQVEHHHLVIRNSHIHPFIKKTNQNRLKILFFHHQPWMHTGDRKLNRIELKLSIGILCKAVLRVVDAIARHNSQCCAPTTLSAL